jgi:hypothetical protein
MSFLSGRTSLTTVQTADLADNVVTLAKMAGGTDGNLIGIDANGDPAYIATGSDGHVLTSGGAGVASAMEAATAADNTPSFCAKLSGSQSFTPGTNTLCALATELWDTDDAFTNTTTYKFTVPSGKAGKYFFWGGGNIGAVDDGEDVRLEFYKNGSHNPVGNLREYASTNGTGVYFTTSMLIDLDVDDYIQMYQMTSASGNVFGPNMTQMGCFKLAGV